MLNNVLIIGIKSLCDQIRARVGGIADARSDGQKSPSTNSWKDIFY